MTDILRVEDEAPKRENIKALLDNMGLGEAVVEARSVGSAIRCLRTEKYDLVILDMSLPTFDISRGESGGRPQGVGGIEVLRYLDRFRVRVPVVVVTAYPAFAQGNKEIDLSSLESTLQRDHPHTFRHLVLYNSMFSTWKTELQGTITEALGL